jgi:hypothetical protein
LAEICDKDLSKGYKRILSQKRALNTIYLGLSLEKLLKQFNVFLHLNSQVDSITKVWSVKFCGEGIRHLLF